LKRVGYHRARAKGKKECRRAEPGANEKKASDEEKVQREKDRENEEKEKKVSKEKTVNQSISAKKMFPIKWQIIPFNYIKCCDISSAQIFIVNNKGNDVATKCKIQYCE